MSERELPRHWAQRLEDLLTGAGTGNVGGPVSSAVNRIVRWGNTFGTLLADSGVTVDGSGNITVPGTVDGRDVSADGAALDAHIANASNPHAVTKTQVGLSAVTNDSQLTRAAGDFATFTAKTVPVSADILLLEDSAASGAKKKTTVAQLQAVLPSNILETQSATLSGGTAGSNTGTFIDVTGSITFTAALNDILVAYCRCDASYGGTVPIIRWSLDGTFFTGARNCQVSGASSNRPLVMVRRFSGLSAGSHTLKVQVRDSGPFGIGIAGQLVVKRVRV